MRARNSDGQLADQFAEINPRVGREVEHQPRSVEGLLDAGELHGQAAFPDFERRHPEGFALSLLVPGPGDDVVVSGEADDALR